jgi:hypothetical protein
VTCEVGLSRSVRAFHIMPGMPGPEGQLHDHDYRIETVVDRGQLDERGMVCDLVVVGSAVGLSQPSVIDVTAPRSRSPRLPGLRRILEPTHPGPGFCC